MAGSQAKVGQVPSVGDRIAEIMNRIRPLRAVHLVIPWEQGGGDDHCWSLSIGERLALVSHPPDRSNLTPVCNVYV